MYMCVSLSRSCPEPEEARRAVALRVADAPHGGPQSAPGDGATTF